MVEKTPMTGNRFSPYTDDNHQAPVWIVTALTLTYAVIFLLTRLAVKIKILGLDDLFLGVAHIFGIAQWGVVIAALKKGVGMSLDSIEGGRDTTVPMGNPAKLVYVSRILLLLALGISKLSIIFFLRDVFAPKSPTAKKRWGVCLTYMIVAGCWTILSVLITSVGCDANDTLKMDKDAQCAGDVTRWRVVMAVEIVLELALVVMPIYLSTAVQITLGRKITVVGAFFPRIIVPGFFIAFVEAYAGFRRDGGTSLDSVSSLVWQQVVLGCALVSATTPCLKGFLGKFRTDGVLGATDGSFSGGKYAHGSRTGTRLESYSMGTMSRKSSFRRIPDDAPPTRVASMPQDLVSNMATAYADPIPEIGDESLKSYGSERMMIHRKVEYDVHTS